MLFNDSPGPIARASLERLRTTVFWLDQRRPVPQCPPLTGDAVCSLLVIGGGFSGLWTALLAKQADPERDVMLLEATSIAAGASGRNGGFVSHSLTHGIVNGADRWPDEMPTLIRMGHENLDAFEKTLADFGIDCGFRRTGELTVAVQEHQVDELQETVDLARAHGDHARMLSREQVLQRVQSASYLGGMVDPDVALVDPARLAWGLLRACLDLGVRVHESSPVRDLVDAGERVVAFTDGGSVTARRVAMGTNAFPPLVDKVSRYVVPVYDYALVTEPLTPAQWASVGWDAREGVGDAGNQFHYYRPTDDGRILWGGYDAIYHRDSGFDAKHEVDFDAFGRLAEHFFQTFPQLEGLSFSHGWGGAIDTCSRFAPFWGSAHEGKTVYVAGYTGLGVGSSRFAAQVMLDIADGRTTERTELEMVRTKPIPFPPEPFRSLGINWTTKSLQSADRREGRWNLWLRTLDRLGMGFDS